MHNAENKLSTRRKCYFANHKYSVTFLLLFDDFSEDERFADSWMSSESRNFSLAS